MISILCYHVHISNIRHNNHKGSFILQCTFIKYTLNIEQIYNHRMQMYTFIKYPYMVLIMQYYKVFICGVLQILVYRIRSMMLLFGHINAML